METLKRVAKECRNDAIRTQMNKIKKIPWQASIEGTRISDASIVNVANEEKQEGCISECKYER